MILSLIVFISVFVIILFRSHIELLSESQNRDAILFVQNIVHKHQREDANNVNVIRATVQTQRPANTTSVSVHGEEWIDAQRRRYHNFLDNFTHINSANDDSVSLLAAPEERYRLSCPLAEELKLPFWKGRTAADRNYRSPFYDETEEKYVTFEPDVGGWNNIRMQMEVVLVFAAATGRTLVLPPDQPMYLLNKGAEKQKAHSFAEFFPFELIRKRMKVITMKEFMEREAITGHLRHNLTGQVIYPPNNRTEFVGTNRDDRLLMWDYLRNATSCPLWKSMFEYVVIPRSPGDASATLGEDNHRIVSPREKLFAAGRRGYLYNEYWQSKKVIHFISKPAWDLRILEHFYTFIYFENEKEDRYYKRFIRDTVHYIDLIFCKAAIIVDKLLKEGRGKYSAFHIRRGEFQYKEVKIPSAKIMENVGEFIPANQLIYIATDEHNKTFFQDMRTRFPVIRFLSDYMEIAKLHEINPNYLGMIDQVVCSRGEVFVGTWFSTFTGYITRMRGYIGHHDYSVYYGDKNHRDRFHHFELPKFPFYMREWNVSWVDIDETN